MTRPAGAVSGRPHARKDCPGRRNSAAGGAAPAGLVGVGGPAGLLGVRGLAGLPWLSCLAGVTRLAGVAVLIGGGSSVPVADDVGRQLLGLGAQLVGLRASLFGPRRAVARFLLGQRRALLDLGSFAARTGGL